MFFSEEKNQKTFTSCARRNIRDLAGSVKPAEALKVFASFFKKEVLPLSPCRKRFASWRTTRTRPQVI